MNKLMKKINDLLNPIRPVPVKIIYLIECRRDVGPWQQTLHTTQIDQGRAILFLEALNRHGTSIGREYRIGTYVRIDPL